ncbi:Casein kinase substrate phosphoprotein PP28 domain-containing protein [Plasmodiophora brassicae]
MTLEDKRREAARLRQEALSPDSELLPTRKEAESLPYDTPVAEDQQERPVVEGKAEKRAGGEGKPTLLNKSDIRKLRRAMKLEEECQQAAGGERPEA